MDKQAKQARLMTHIVLLSTMSILSVGPIQAEGVAQPMAPSAITYVKLPPDDSSEQVANVDSSVANEPVANSQIDQLPAAVNPEVSWPMAAANPERTSWTPEEVRGRLQPEWFRPIEPYIPAKVQIIAANDILYVSTARGLYALDAATGAEKWVYPTEMPLGNSPTISNSVAYVGGFDNKLHAINALTGQGLWTFEAEAGFDTNPLVVNGLVYAGNRDGYMYAIYANESPQRGTLAWKYPTGEPIHFSAAYKNGTIYFASNDAYAYALDAATGALKWKSAKLPVGNGFHSWWPVVAGDVVIFSASRGYRVMTPPQVGWSDASNIYTKGDAGYTPPMGARLPDGSMDATQALQYLESKPWRRVYYILNRANGQEVTYDFDQDGKAEYAPLLNAGTNSGNKYPAVIDSDGTIYTFNNFSGDTYGQGVAGWKLGAASITTPGSNLTANDEPLAYAIGGSLIYWNQCCDRTGGAFDISTGQKWKYFDYNLNTLVPGYDVMYAGTVEARAVAVYGGWNGVYGSGGDQNPPIPYKGRVYMHRSNAIIAWSTTGGAQPLPLSRTRLVQENRAIRPGILSQKLAEEVQKIVDAGHLRPGFGIEGVFSLHGRHEVGDNLTDYWHNPLDTIYTLTRAYPYLSSDLQGRVKVYLQSEFANYPPCQYTTVGWDAGAAREAFELPPEVSADIGKGKYPPWAYSTNDFAGWTGPDWKWTPHTFYALWKYAQVFGGARNIFDACKSRLWTPPSDDILSKYPFAHNAWIAGYWGYLELEKLAGYPEEASKRAILNQLLNLRATNFAKDNPWGPDSHDFNQAFAIARNFVFLTPELGQYLRDNALSKVQTAYDEYKEVAPYWFVTRFEATYNEDVMHHLYDYSGMFAAKAWILKDPYAELSKYVDVPAFAVGDLFYIQNLVTTLEASGQVIEQVAISKTPSRSAARQGETVTYTLAVLNLGSSATQTVPMTVTDTLPSGMQHVSGLCAASQGMPVCSAMGVTWTGIFSTSAPVVISYTARVTTDSSVALTNRMVVDAGSYGVYTRTVTIMANPLQIYLPMILKGAGG